MATGPSCVQPTGEGRLQGLSRVGRGLRRLEVLQTLVGPPAFALSRSNFQLPAIVGGKSLPGGGGTIAGRTSGLAVMVTRCSSGLRLDPDPTNVAPVRTSGTGWCALTALQPARAASSSWSRLSLVKPKVGHTPHPDLDPQLPLSRRVDGLIHASDAVGSGLWAWEPPATVLTTPPPDRGRLRFPGPTCWPAVGVSRPARPPGQGLTDISGYTGVA